MMDRNSPRPALSRTVLLASALLLPWITLPATAQQAPTNRPASWHARGVFLSEERLQSLKERVDRQVEPTYAAWRELLTQADAALDRQPHAPAEWYVPGYYRDPRGHSTSKRGLQGDADAAYRLALAYRIAGDEAYARAAVRLIRAWATQVESLSTRDDSTLSFSYHFPGLIFAADLLKDAPPFSAADQETFKEFVREKALPMNTMDRRNNWGNWGLVLFLASAAYLDDPALFEQGVARWKEFIETQIAPDGHLPHEVGRNNGRGERGIWYSHFSLMPQTIAAEIARVNGVDLYEYRSPGGHTLRQAFERLAPWTRRPETFPYYKGEPGGQLGTNYYSYFEILNARWPHPDATALLHTARPLTANHCTPHLTFTHGDLLHDSQRDD